MKTIKCPKCGCEMSAMSEACPMCGVPMQTLNPNKESFSDIPLCSVDESKVYDITLKDAVVMAAGQVKNNPLSVVYINPCDEDIYTITESFMDRLCIGNMTITNRPKYTDKEYNEKPLKTIQDCEDVANEIQQILIDADIAELGAVQFSKMSILGILFDSFKEFSESVKVELYLGSDAEQLETDINSFNRSLPKGMGKLTLDNEALTLIGEVKSLPVKGGMFEKRKLKKLNEDAIQSLHELIVKCYPYLEESL